MCEKMREEECVLQRLRRFIALVTGDAKAPEELFLEIQKTTSIGPNLGEYDRAYAMNFFRSAFRAIIGREADQASRPARAGDENSTSQADLPAAANLLLDEFQRLPLGAKAAMALVVIERWSIEETAAIMDTTPDHIRNNLLEARRHISGDLWRKDYLSD